jgi:Sec7-like guanine-nucleotide exchange factor
MGNCCVKNTATRTYANSIEKPLSEFQHNRSRTPDGIITNNRTDTTTISTNTTSNHNRVTSYSQRLDKNGIPIENEESYYSTGITKFNIKPKDGIAFLNSKKLINIEDPLSVAKFLCSRRIFIGRSTLQSGLNKKKLGEYLGSWGGKTKAGVQYHQQLLLEYVKLSVEPIIDVDIDQALRTFLNHFVLPGEGQMIDRIVQAFAEHYHASNPSLFQHSDTAHILAFGVIMLHTDAHNKTVKKKMTLIQFINMMKGIDQGKDLNKTML